MRSSSLVGHFVTANWELSDPQNPSALSIGILELSLLSNGLAQHSVYIGKCENSLNRDDDLLPPTSRHNEQDSGLRIVSNFRCACDRLTCLLPTLNFRMPAS